jgi:nicotinate-nucleotide adenylyltransferase
VFDPIHYGHLRLAEDIQKTGGIDGVLFVPSWRPPHKVDGDATSFENRLAMVRLAVAGRGSFVVSDIEAELNGPGYTLNVIRALKNRYRQATFSFVMGADNVDDMKKWYHPEEILDEIEVIAGSRPGFEPHVDRFPADRVRLVATSMIDLSSSQIRKRVAAGIDLEDLAQMVPAAVAGYIEDKGLYR